MIFKNIFFQLHFRVGFWFVLGPIWGAILGPFWLNRLPARRALLGLKASKTASCDPWYPQGRPTSRKTRPRCPKGRPRVPKTLHRTPQDPPKRPKIDPRLPEDRFKESFSCYFLVSSICSSLSLLSSFFSLPFFLSSLFVLLSSIFSFLFYSLFFLRYSLLSLSLSSPFALVSFLCSVFSLLFSSFSPLPLLPNCGGELYLLGPPGAIWGRSWGLLGRSGRHLGRSRGLLGRSWGLRGRLLGPLGAILGRSWGLLERLGGHLGALGGDLRTLQVQLGSWSRLGTVLSAEIEVFLGACARACAFLERLLKRFWRPRGVGKLGPAECAGPGLTL